MSNDSWSTCSGTFYDSGGPVGNYANNEDLTATLCPAGGSGSGPATAVFFAEWAVQPGTTDQLFIYDGTTTGDPLIATGSGTTSLLGQTITATGPTGCLTFRWVSDGANTFPGWRALITTGPDAGDDASIIVCGNAPAFNMTAQLGGSPDPVGQWTDPNAVSHGSTFNPLNDPDGVWTYTVSGPSPCPDAVATLTITKVPPANAGGNASLTLCSTSAPVDLFTALGGTPTPGGTWTDPNGNAHSGTFDPDTDTPGGYVYSVAGTAPCGMASATVTVTVNPQPVAGVSTSTTVCGNAPPFSLFALLGATAQPGGSWTDGNAQPHPATYTPGSSTPGIYTYTIPALAPCVPAVATVEVIQVAPANAGGPASIAVCSSDAPFVMTNALAGSPDPNGQWFDPLGDPYGSTFDPSTDQGGPWTYEVAGTAPCANATAILTITVRQAPDPGSDATVTVCSDGSSFALIDELGGTPDANGTWVGPGGPSGGTFVPGSSPAGPYVYTVTGQAPCPALSATLTVDVVTAPNAGGNGTAELCSNASPLDLLTVLSGSPDATGTWTDPFAQATGSTFIPGTGPPGSYLYTVAGQGPCADATATATVNVTTAPDAGVDATWTSCSSDAAFDLFDRLGGTPDGGGSWTDPDGLPFPSGVFDPASGLAGTYLYQVNGTGPCAPAIAALEVEVVPAPDAGVNGSITVCSDQGPLDLFTLLGGTPDANGTWTGPGNVPHSGTYLPGTEPGGTYTYTVTGISPCANAQATVQVTRRIAPRAGNDGGTTICANVAPFDLITLLGGNPMTTGSWLNPFGTPFPSGTFVPGTSAPGEYTYVVTGQAPCLNDTAVATVNVVIPPNAGFNGSITVCGDAPSFPLVTVLGGIPDGGGSWTGPGPDPHGPLYEPLLDAPGIYTYTVPGTVPCANATAVAVVQEVQPPDPGTSSTITVCGTDAPFDLLTQLGGTPAGNGTWSGPLGAHGGSFDPAIDQQGIYTYTVPGVSPCSSRTATVTVVVNPAPFAGGSATVSRCENSGSVDLFPFLLGSPDPTGTWTDAGTGQLSGSVLNTNGLAVGTYVFTYTVPANGQCPASSATVTLNIVPLLNAGINTLESICGNTNTYDLLANLNGSPDPGGTWTVSPPTPGLSGGLFNASLASPGTYVFTYTLGPSGGCPAASATLTINVQAAPNAGLAGDTLVCGNAGPFNMVLVLNGTPQPGGSWLRLSDNSPHPATFTPGTSQPGQYRYTVNAPPPCGAVSAEVTINVQGAPDAGTNRAVEVCTNGQPFNMLDSLGGTPSPLGTWQDPNALLHASIFVPGVDPSGAYVYSVPGIFPCGNAVAVLSVTVTPRANAGLDGDTIICSNGSAFPLLAVLNGSPDASGQWFDTFGLPMNGVFDPSAHPAGMYQYVVQGSGSCQADTAWAEVVMNTRPFAGITNAVELCSGTGNVDLLPLLGGADPGGTWRDPNGNVHGGTFQPNDPPGAYTYRVEGIAPCLPDSATVNVAVITSPSAGISATHIACSSDPPFSMINRLGGAPQQGGVWSGPVGNPGLFFPASDTPGQYTYTVTTPGCPPAQSTLTISVSAQVNAGNDNGTSVCRPGPNVPLFPLLGPNAQPGGSWFGPTWAPHGGTFINSTDPGGEYRYVRYAQAPCANDTARISVIVTVQQDPGFNGVRSVCSSEPPFALFTVLGGTPSLSGTWWQGNTQVSGLYFPGNEPPGVQVFEYRVGGTGPCPVVFSTVTIIQYQAPEAGGDAAQEVCSDQSAFSLLPLLQGNPDQGGQWFDPFGVLFPGGQYIPGASAPGTYTYRVNGIAPCVADSATVTVIEYDAVDAGIDAAVQLCANAPTQPLLGLLNGSPDTGGTWTGPLGVVPSGDFDPLTMPGGSYIYRLFGVPPCANDSASVFITKVPAPDAGLNGSNTVCLDEPAVQLFPVLQGSPTPGGAWANLSGQGVLTGSTWNAVGVPPGTYEFTYTVAGVGPCPAANSTVTIQVATGLDAGDDATVDLCESATFVDLFSLLGGQPQTGGQWRDDDSTGAMLNGVLNANLAGVGTWSFTYVLGSSGSCLSDSATVTVNVIEGPFAGCPGSVTVCSSDAPFLLLQVVGCAPDLTGSWTGPNGPVPNGEFIPGVDSAGVYTYTVDAVGDCPASQTTVTVTVSPAPFAGQDSSLLICSNSPPVQLFTLLPGATPGGTWTLNSNPNSGTYNPQVHNSGLAVYTVSGGLFCPPDQATIQITENLAPNAGIDNTIQRCSSDPSFNLTAQLMGNPMGGGQWLRPGLIPHGSGTFNPALHPGGVWTYVVPGLGACANDTALLTINLTPANEAGTGGILNVCASDTAVNLFAGLTGTVTSGGSWQDVDATGALTDSLFNATIPGVGQYAFIYSLPPAGACPAAQSTVVANVTAGTQLGVGGLDTICGGLTSYDLFNSLTGATDPGGVWTDDLGTGALIPPSFIDASLLPQGTAIPFTYTVTSPACGDVSVTVLIHTTAFPDPGSGGGVALCADAAAVDLFTVLGGTPQAGGAWTQPNGQVHSGTFVPGTDIPGNYTYLLAGSPPCTDTAAVVVVSVNQPPQAGADTTVVLCDNDGVFDLFDALIGASGSTGTWSDLDASGALAGSLVDPSGLVPGIYRFEYRLEVPGCGADQAVVSLRVVNGVEVGAIERDCIVRDRTYVVTFTLSGGDPSTYSITGPPGSLSGTAPVVFTSVPIPTSQGFAFTVTDGSGCATRVIEGASPCQFDDEVFVPGLFSPNGDGINDRFIIPGIEGFPGNRILVFNRWGDEVYRGEGYDNRTVVWDGSADKALLKGPLPTGTYYYILELGGGREAIKGHVYLNR